MKKSMYLCSLALAALLTSCITMPVITLDSVDTDQNELKLDRGSITQVISDSDSMVLMTSTAIDENEGGVIVGIGNTSHAKQTFLDSQIEIFGGNYDTGEWEKIGNWNAQGYYQNAKNEAATSEFLTAFSGALMTISSAMGSTSTSNVYTPYGSYTVHTHTYDPMDTLLTGMIAADAVNDVKLANKTNLDWLSDNLLYSSDIEPEDVYSGIVFFDASDYPDYMLRMNGNGNTPKDFIYQRSDRAEIINPWLDRSKMRHSIALDFGFPQDNIGLYYFMSQPKGVGLYAGVTGRGLFSGIDDMDNVGNMYSGGSFYLDSSFKDKLARMHGVRSYQIDGERFEPDGVASVTGMDMPIGITIKTVPYTWLLVGLDTKFIFDKNVPGYVYYSVEYGPEQKYPEKVTLSDYAAVQLAGQFGVNFIANMLDLYILGSYDFMEGSFSADMGIGFAF